MLNISRPAAGLPVAKIIAIALVISALMAALLSGPVQAGQNVLVLQSVSIAPYEQAVKGFAQVFGSEPRRLVIADLKEKDVLRKIREIRPDMVLAVGRDALLIARRIATIPVVYCMVLNPRAILSGEKNISGVSMYLPPEKQLGELLRVLPATRTIGLLYDPDQTGIFVQGVRDAATRTDVSLAATAVRRSRDVPALLNTMQGKAGLFWMLPDATVITPETVESILLLSLDYKIPIVTFSEKYLELGAMLSIGVDPFDIGCQAGEMAQTIFSGASGDAQHADARKALIAVNMKIARKLGITLDQRVLKTVKVIP